MSQLPKILVVYFTQTGQLKRIIDNVLAPLQGKAAVVYEQLEPESPFPFPWPKQQFFDAMPETVLARPRAIKPLKVNPDEHFDLVIMAYQPWFLSPSQPVAAFLQSPEAARLLKGRPVVTLLGCRNMWINAQEKVKRYLHQLGANLVGHIALADTHHNLVSLITILRWSTKGKKDAFFIFPPAGVQEKDIVGAARFAAPIAEALEKKAFSGLHGQLLALRSVEMKPGLIVLEMRGVKPFRFFANFISAKGGPGDAARQGRVTLYRVILLLAIPFLSPFTTVASWLKLLLLRKQLNEDVAYYKGISLREG
ncbi:dialkylrecorsinol condensing enzyme [Chitinophaga alhagiae]|uniref:Dialkylrecorsinol condensing enzyme n=1 Tax=Chitinophaga alhagiae TaxID=2203219 RepID=A0ABN5LQG5_9BACT|nr:dialkylrecorsinol condensing enzyme [Chitinophaga alhagiae]AWO00740.1 dialkylrecorsinol condensing enzyme [Chitinophaga alhagiae]